MLPLGLFRIRNFWVANLTTLSAYAGLIGGLFFVGLFLQQVAGYSPLEAGLATTPISILMFFLSPRFGRIASGTGPRLPMTAGPIVGGVGLLLLLRVGSDAELPPDVLPGPAGLRRRPLGDGGAADRDRARLGRRTPRRDRLGGQQRRLPRRRPAGDRCPRRGDLGPASAPSSTTSSGTAPLSGPAAAAVAEAKEKPLAVPVTDGVPRQEGDRVVQAAEDASTSSFHLGIGIAGILMIIGGIVAGLGVQNPERRTEAVPSRGQPQAGECGHGSNADCAHDSKKGRGGCRHGLIVRQLKRLEVPGWVPLERADTRNGGLIRPPFVRRGVPIPAPQ